MTSNFLCVTLTWLIHPHKKSPVKTKHDLSVTSLLFVLFLQWMTFVFFLHVLRRAEIKCEINHLISQLVWPFARKKMQGLFCVNISNSMNSQQNKNGIYISREIWSYWEVSEGVWVCEKGSCWIVIKHLGFLDSVRR